MDVTALGMIETVGLVTAIEAADAGLKAADVRLLGTDYVRGGLVMVRFEGEVAAVNAAVDAGTSAAQRIGKVFASHVIARAMPEVFCMLSADVGEGPAKRAQDGCAQCGGCEGGRRDCAPRPEPSRKKQKPTASDDGPTARVEDGEQRGTQTNEAPKVQLNAIERATHGGKPRPTATVPDNGADEPVPNEPVPLSELAGWKVVRLRTYVRSLQGFPLKPNDIRYATRQVLLDALADWLPKEE